MAPPHTPQKRKTTRRKADTITKTRFYDAVDKRGSDPLRKVYGDQGVKKSTGDLWLTQRRLLALAPEAAYRRLGAFRTGPQYKVSDEQLDQLIDAQ